MSFQVGDTVYVATFDCEYVREPCPVCFGDLSVRLTLGDGTEIKTPCGYCGHGYDGPRGYTKELCAIEPRAKAVTVQKVYVEDGYDGQRVTYDLTDHYHVDSDRVFSDKDAAMVRAKEMQAERNAREAAHRKHRKDGQVQSLAWHVGYHKKQAKEAQRQLDYHSAKVVMFKALARAEKKPAPSSGEK